MIGRTWLRMDGSTATAIACSPDRPPGPGWEESADPTIARGSTRDAQGRWTPPSVSPGDAATVMGVLPSYPNNSAALAAGLPPGALYTNVAGIQQVQGAA